MSPDEKTRIDNDEAAAPATDDDTEGHSLGMVMAVNELIGNRPAQGQRSYRRDDDELKPINKRFPRMREGKRD